MRRRGASTQADASQLPGLPRRPAQARAGPTGRCLAAPFPRARATAEAEVMRYESSVTSLSWIPSEAVTGSTRLAFDAGIGHYDDPPPGELTDIAALQAADRFRFANVLRAWIEVGDDGQISGAGYAGGGPDGLDDRQARGAEVPFPGGCSCRTCSASPSTAMAGCGSARPSAAGPACRRRGGSAASRSSSGRRRWYGRRSRLPCMPTGAGGLRDDRRKPVPAALDLRQRRPAGAQIRSH